MAEQTTNYGLKKPSQSDLVNVQDFNENFDIIDENMGNFAILEDVGEPLEEEMPRDADLLGGEPKSYFEGLVGTVGNDVNAIENKIVSQDISSLLVNGYSVYASHPFKATRSGNIVVLSMYLITIGETTPGTTILYLPQKFKPSSSRYCEVHTTDGLELESTTQHIRLLIYPDGQVVLQHDYTHKSLNPFMMGTIVFSI